MKIIGLMSGTSLDGLDIALCSFAEDQQKYRYTILHAETIAYPDLWKKSLAEAHLLHAEAYAQLHAAYGAFLGEQCRHFLQRHMVKADAIASHGHTVFHQPALGFTTQLGCGATIAALTGIQTVCDFRSKDVALKGQGAPLVPIGDALLFGEADACLNIGGIANLSFQQEQQRMAYDICEANMVLNYLAEKLGMPYDRGGNVAATHPVDSEMLQRLNALPFYRKDGAKSLGREWFQQQLVPLIHSSPLSVPELLATFTEHVAHIIAENLSKQNLHSTLITGGGAFNDHLVKRIQCKTSCRLILPDPLLINFKEALIFAFLGYLRLNHRINTLSTVTGAKANSIGGAVYLGD